MCARTSMTPIVLQLLLLATLSCPAPAAAAAATAGVPSPGDLLDCLRAALPGASPAKVVGPSDAAYETASIMGQGWRAEPAAVVYAYETPDVVAAVDCARQAGVGVSVAGGRHSYAGWSLVTGYLGIDMSNVTEFVFDKEAGTVRAGAGATNGLLMSAVAGSGVEGAASLIGTCPSVGVVGYLLGGGQGDITPYVGLGCDQLVELELVLANGTVVNASETEHPELYWASKGGGTGLGAITHVTLQYHALPDPNHLTAFHLIFREDARVEGLVAFQDWLATTADRRFGGSGAMSADFVGITGLFLGPWQEGVRMFNESGLLAYAPTAALAPSTVEGVAVPEDQVPPGLFFNEFRDYTRAEAYLICVTFLNTLPGSCAALGLPCEGAIPDCVDDAVLKAMIKQLGQKDSPLNMGASDLWRPGAFTTAGGRNIKRLPAEAWEALSNLTRAGAAYKTCEPGEAIMIQLNHFIHGKPTDVPPNATAVPWRDVVMSLSLTNSLPPGVPTDPKEQAAWADAGLTVAEALGSYVDACEDLGAAFMAILDQYLPGGAEAANGYVNYLSSTPVTGDDWQSLYFGSNYPRLQAAKAAYDPTGVFSKPQTITLPGGTAPDVPDPMHLWDSQAQSDAPTPASAPQQGQAPSAAAARRSAALLAVLLAAGAALLLPIL